MKKIIITFLIFAAALFYMHVSRAAMLTVTPAAITIDTQGESVNAVELHLTFDPQEFSIKAVDDGGSIVNVWLSRPAFSNDKGTVDLAGIIPGGITTANGNIITLILVPARDGGVITKGFTVASGQVLLNDGKGTSADLTVRYGMASAASSSSTPTPDLYAPDPFIPTVAHDPNLFDGQYFVAFAATDQGSGIDRYEVLEVPQGTSVGNITVWQTAESPYLLHDQSLKSDIYVRAIDKAGNFRTVKISAADASAAGNGGSSPQGVPERTAAILIGIGVLLIGISLHLWNGKKRRS